MIAIQVMGEDNAVAFAGSQGNFELNAMRPMIVNDVLHMTRILADGAEKFRTFSVEGTELDEGKIASYVGRSLMLVTALSPVIGYQKAGPHRREGRGRGHDAAARGGAGVGRRRCRHLRPRLRPEEHGGRGRRRRVTGAGTEAEPKTRTFAGDPGLMHRPPQGRRRGAPMRSATRPTSGPRGAVSTHTRHPGPGWMPTRPPRSCTVSRTMARPRPWPALTGSSLRNRSNTCASSPGGTPAPSSSTERAATLSPARSRSPQRSDTVPRPCSRGIVDEVADEVAQVVGPRRHDKGVRSLDDEVPPGGLGQGKGRRRHLARQARPGPRGWSGVLSPARARWSLRARVEELRRQPDTSRPRPGRSPPSRPLRPGALWRRRLRTASGVAELVGGVGQETPLGQVGLRQAIQRAVEGLHQRPDLAGEVLHRHPGREVVRAHGGRAARGLPDRAQGSSRRRSR